MQFPFIFAYLSLSLSLLSFPLSLCPTLPSSLPLYYVPLKKEQLRIAIIDYLNHHSREKEKLEQLQLVALKFKMFRELAKVKEQQVTRELKKIKPKSLGKDERCIS